ncbi:MAG: histidine kinase N-terminal 7TM domain-containing protein [Lentimicrobium sp.]|nr:histidine kinase N-terminal 7TM domain-containing protein [Lentimicrobium sp.]
MPLLQYHFFIAIYSHSRGHSNHQHYFTLMMIMVSYWAMVSTLESASTELSAKIFWSKLEYIGSLSTATFFFRVAIGVAEIRNNRLIKNFWAFWILPVLLIILASTNEMHHLVWTGFSWNPNGNNILIYHHAIGFYLSVGYSLLLVAISQIIIVKALPKMPMVFKRQAWSIILACIFPFLAAIIYATGNEPVEGLNIIVMSFLLSGMVLLFGITQYKMFDIAPFARKRLSEMLKDALLLIDPQNKIIYHNPTASKLLNIQSRYFYSDLKEINWLYNACIEHLSNNITDNELTVKAPEDVWLNIQIIRIFDENSALKGNLMVLRDISRSMKLEIEAERLNQELAISHKQLIDLNNQKDKILSIIGHDLKTSFHQITSLAKILNEENSEGDTDITDSLVKDILKASDNGCEILAQLISWAKVHQESTTIIPCATNLNSALTQIINSITSVTKAKNIEIINNIPETAIVFAEMDMITIVFRNLLINAIKFSYDRGKIYLSATNEGNKVKISIRDEGTGISEKDLSTMFTKNSHSKPGTKGEKGTGLGLLLSQELLTKNNGSIQVQSKPGEGAEFIVSLPSGQDAGQESASPIIEYPL